MRSEREVPHCRNRYLFSLARACLFKATCHAIRKLVNFTHRAVREAHEVMNSLAPIGTTVAVLCIDAYYNEVPKLTAINIFLRC